jgi:hypothetical protein
MKNKRSGMPSVRTIRQYWANNLNLEKKGFDSVFEFLEDDNYCFACGFTHGEVLHRAHIFPICKGGNNEVHNLHCLCRYCHKASEYLYGDGYWEWFYERSIVDVMFQASSTAGLNLHAFMMGSSTKEEQCARFHKSVKLSKLLTMNN